MTAGIANLQRLVALIDERRAAKTHSEAIIAELVRDYGARYNDLNVYRLRLAGVASSSEAAPTYLIANWQKAARLKIAEAQDACAGHVASKGDPKVCDRCGIHIDELRPPDDDGFNPHGSGPVPIEEREG